MAERNRITVKIPRWCMTWEGMFLVNLVVDYTFELKGDKKTSSK